MKRVLPQLLISCISCLVLSFPVSAPAEPGPRDVALAMPSAGGTAADLTPRDVALAMPSAGGTAAVPAPIASTVDAAAVREAIEGANQAWLEAFRSGDEDALARIYTTDASLFPPANASLEGRDRIVEYFRTQRDAGMGEASLKTLDVVCVGDVAYEVGTYGFRFDGGFGGMTGDAGRYFAIWKAQDDGSWRYQVGIWSSNRDAAAAR